MTVMMNGIYMCGGRGGYYMDSATNENELAKDKEKWLLERKCPAGAVDSSKCHVCLSCVVAEKRTT